MKHLDKRLKRYGVLAAGIAAVTPLQAQEEVEVNSLLKNNYFDLNGDGQNDFSGYGYSYKSQYTKNNTYSTVYLSSGSFYGGFNTDSQSDYTVNFQNGLEDDEGSYFFLSPGDTVGPNSSFETNSYYSWGYGQYIDTTSVVPKENPPGGGAVIIKEPISEEIVKVEKSAQIDSHNWTYRDGAFKEGDFEKELYLGVRMAKKVTSKSEGPIKAIELKPTLNVEETSDSIYYGWIKFILDYEPAPQSDGGGEQPIDNEGGKELDAAKTTLNENSATSEFPTVKIISHYMNDVVNEEVVIPAEATGLVESSGVVLGVYPNPASDFVTVSAESNIESITIVDLKGKPVISTFDTQIDVSSLGSGMYFILANTSEGVAATQFIKE